MLKEPYIYRGALSITPSSVVEFSVIVNKVKNYNSFKSASNKSNGISNATIKRIRNAIKVLHYNSPKQKAFNQVSGKYFYWQMNFITLTLPTAQTHSDKEIKQVFNSFLQSAKYLWNLELYVWRAEIQINGNIHFHLTTNVFIPYLDLRRVWNNCLEKLGYITEFEKKHNHRNPNSTDVHSVKNIKDISKYLSKYLTKKQSFKRIGVELLKNGKTFEIMANENELNTIISSCKLKVNSSIIYKIREVEGHCFGCSRNLVKKCTIYEDEEEFEEVQRFEFSKKAKYFQSDFALCVYDDDLEKTAFKPILDKYFKIVNS